MDTIVEVKADTPFELCAYCLMPNHWHMVIRELDTSVSEIYHRIQTIYVKYFNRRYGFVGHVYQGRFKAKLIDTPEYLLGATRYVHMNPVDAGLVANPEDWRWSGHAEFAGKSSYRLLDLGLPLSILSEDAVRAEARYREYMNARIKPGPKGPWKFKKRVPGTDLVLA